MTNSESTTMKTNHHHRMFTALAELAMLASMLVAGGVALAATATFSNSSPIQIGTLRRTSTRPTPIPPR